MDAPPPCTDGNTKAITAEDTVPHRLRDPSGGRSSRSPTTLPATEQWVRELWVRELWVKRQIHALVAVDTHGFASLRSVWPG